MKKSYANISRSCIFVTLFYSNAFAQSRRVYSNNELNFQYGFSLKGTVELGLRHAPQKTIYRLCANFGIGSNLLARALYFSFNEELQLYNGGLGSSRRPGNKKPPFTLDFISAFTLTTGLHNYFTDDGFQGYIRRSVPLYYFLNYTTPALQNPYDYSISAGTNLIFSSDKLRSKQRVGFLNIHCNKMQISYYNDGGTPFDETYLGDSKDRFYTGGALLSYHGSSSTYINLVELTFQKFTGYSKNAFEVSNKLDLSFVNYNKAEEKYYNKSLWTLNIANPEDGWGLSFNRYNYTNWDIQHLIHFGIFNAYHLVPYDDYFSISGNYYHNYTNIGLR